MARLPDLCLLNIFSRVPLHHLLGSVRLVSSYWNQLVPTELHKRCSLTLVQHCRLDARKIRKAENPIRSNLMFLVRRGDDGSPWLRIRPFSQIIFNALCVPGRVLTDGFALSLMKTLARITRLTIVQSNSGLDSALLSLTHTTSLLTHYRHSLVSLKIEFSCPDQLFTDENHQTQMHFLLRSINRLGSLRHLTLNVTWPEWNGPTDLSILTQLDTFTSNLSTPVLIDSIFEYIVCKPTNIRMDCRLSLHLETILGFNRQLNFTSVQIFTDFSVDEHQEKLRLFATRMTSITRLTLDIESMPMTMITRCLAPLTKLVYLQLDFVLIPREEVTLDQQDFVQLSSVRVLHLSFVTKSHHDTERLHTAELFPDIQVLLFYQAFSCCPDCGLVDVNRMIDHVTPEERHKMKNCKYLAREPFRRCALLRTIKYHESDQDVYQLIEDD